MSNHPSGLPLYLQIRQDLVDMLLDQPANDLTIPSIRQWSMEKQVNPLTMKKAYQSLIDEGILEPVRGMTYRWAQSGKEKLIEQERDRFLTQTWPVMESRMHRLGLSCEDLSKATPKSG